MIFLKKIAAVCFLVWLPFSVSASESIETSGDVLQVAIPALAFGTTFYLDDKEGRMQFYKSFLTTVVVTHGMKHTIEKERPNGGGQSFPSGHTSAAFQGAAFIQKRYGLKYGIPAYVGASFVGYSRVESDKHYVEDVLAGAAIGTAAAYFFTTPYQNAVVMPVVSRTFYGVKVDMVW